MNQAALIQALCDDLTPTISTPATQGLSWALLIGGGMALAAMIATLGVQPGLDHGPAQTALLFKAGVTIAVAMLALRSLAAMARPGAAKVPLLPGLAGAVAAMVCAGLGQMLVAGEAVGGNLVFGASWQACPWRIAALSLPLMASLFWALRRQAPVHLQRTGAVAGLCSGACAAGIYALACPEQSAVFMLLWYGLGIGMATLAGLLAGPRLLRW